MNGQNNTDAQPLTPQEVKNLLGQHRQMRQKSCFQSVPEMWLKLNRIIGWTDYPEQLHPENDQKGYEPYPDNACKPYNSSSVLFRKETFNPPYDTLFSQLTAELAEGRYVVVSLRPPWGGGWHGYLVTHKVNDDFVVFTKNGLAEADTEEDRLRNRLLSNEKVDCLFMKVVMTANFVRGMQALNENRIEDALEAFDRESPESPCYGLALANRGVIEIKREQFGSAEQTCGLALSLFLDKGCEHPPTWVQTMRVLGESVSLQGRVQESIPIFQEGCDLAEELSEHFPQFAVQLALEKAYTFHSLGGASLKTEDAQTAVNYYTAARDIYRNHRDNRIGHAETLVDLAQAYIAIGRMTDAEFAIREATPLAQGNPAFVHRVNEVAVRLGLYAPAESRRLLLEAAHCAEQAELFDTAYTRHCIAASLAEKANDPVWGLEAVRLAEAIEPRLREDNLAPAKLFFYKAALLEKAGRPIAEVLSVLLQGAQAWCQRLPGKLNVLDYRDAVRVLHDHFRKLSSVLLQENRKEEAFVAFEMGRARGFWIEASKGKQDPILNSNAFRHSRVDVEILDRIRDALEPDEVFVSVAIIPSNLVAFILGKDGLSTRSVPLVQDLAQANAFRESLRLVPENLRQGRGIDSIPAHAGRIAAEIADQVGQSRITLFAPHSILHSAPWRALLHNAGIPWTQLPFITRFSPLLDLENPNPDTVFRTKVIALGYGTAGIGADALNLEDEAEEFAAAFEADGQFVPQARSTDVISALNHDNIVLLSCHGRIIETETANRFVFDLADGSHEPDKLIQNTVSTPFVILSACSSGTYEMEVGDYPVGAAPKFLLAGAKFCICTRFPIDAHFAKALFLKFAELLAGGLSVGNAFARSLEAMEQEGFELWRHLSCAEVLGRGI